MYRKRSTPYYPEQSAFQPLNKMPALSCESSPSDKGFYIVSKKDLELELFKPKEHSQSTSFAECHSKGSEDNSKDKK